jgi:3-dehydroquinate synthase
MVLAARLSATLGRAPVADADRLAALLVALGLPVVPPAHETQRVLELMRLDKKNLGHRLRLVLWAGIGHAGIAEGVPAHAILQLLERG